MNTLFRLSLLCLVSACLAPPSSALRTQVEITTDTSDADLTSRAIAMIQGAENSLRIALPQHPVEGEAANYSTDLGAAILEAWDRGVAVEVLTDIDEKNDPVIQSLNDADVPVRLADSDMGYYEFNYNTDVAWTSEQAMMSHAWVMADSTRFFSASRIGGTDGVRVAISGESEDIATDMAAEFRQVFGGTDATAMDAYSAPAKSITDNRWHYGSSTDADIELWFGPQERLTKRLIDAVYGARSSIRVMTDNFSNEGLALALQQKAADGFDVQVIVGSQFTPSAADPSGIFNDDTPDVQKFAITDDIAIPTIVIIDFEGGTDTTRKAFVLSHDIVSSARFYNGGNEVVSDQLIDGNLWVIDDWGTPSPMFDPLVAVWNSHLDIAEAF